MPGSELIELAKAGGYDEFEARCLDMLESGRLSLPQLVGPFEQLERSGQAERLGTLTQMVLENVDPAADPQAALTIARIALFGSPQNEDLRNITAELYRQVHGDTAGFNVILEASGITGGRPVRMALNLLDLCLTLQPGDTLISRMDDRVVEVTDIDRENGLFTLRRGGRTTTVPAAEVGREYERVASDDFRVLRRLRPQQLTKLIHEDPVAVVIGLIHAHGEQIDADVLKHELVPRYIASKEWSRWWTRARSLLKRSPHVIIEGRSPILLRYCAEGRTLEEETWEALQEQNEPVDWMGTIESYLREKAARKETPDAALLHRFHDHIVRHITAVQARRPAEALTGALVIARMGEKGAPTTGESRSLAATMLRDAADPCALLRGMEDEGLRKRGLRVLQSARPADWVQYSLAWLPTAPAGLLDRLATAAIDAGHVEMVQSLVDSGLNDPANHPELIYWLWRGPKKASGLNLPSDDELFRLILDTLSSLGRTVPADADLVREFRQRMKAALSLRDYEKVRRCLEKCSEAGAITIRGQLRRLEGLGARTPARMLDLLRDVHPQLWVVKRQQIAAWEDSETVWCTAEGLSRRTANRDEIVHVRMPENAKRIGDAASHGDLSENSEYRFALEERDLLRARLAAINGELSRARTLEPYDVPSGHVGIGSRVTLRCMADGSERVMTFLGPFETDVDRGVYSYLAPVSQMLMGRRVGHRVVLAFDGREMEFEIVALGSALTEERSEPQA